MISKIVFHGFSPFQYALKTKNLLLGAIELPLYSHYSTHPSKSQEKLGQNLKVVVILTLPLLKS